jgi:hypothetical protein
LELLRYVSYIKDEKEKIQRFLSGFPAFYKDKIQFDEPKTLEETIRKAKYLYDQSKGRAYFQKSWRDKKKDKQDQRKKGFQPPFFKNNPNTYQQSQPTQSGSKMEESLGKRARKPIKCWGCEGNHLYRDFPQKEGKNEECAQHTGGNYSGRCG